MTRPGGVAYYMWEVKAPTHDDCIVFFREVSYT